MAKAGNSQSLNVILPLSLEVLESEQKISEDGLITIACDLRKDIDLLRGHILKHRNLSFVTIDKVIYDAEANLIFLALEFNNESQLDLLFECLKNRDNELSECISKYVRDKSLEIIAGLQLNTKIRCTVWMQKVVYCKCQVQLYEGACESWEERESKLQPTKPSVTQSGALTDLNQTSGFVRRAAKEIGQIIELSSKNKSCSSQSSPASQDQTLKNEVKQKQESDITRSEIGISSVSKPGSYPRARSSSEGQSSQEYTGARKPKTFCLYIPETKLWTIKKIILEIPDLGIAKEMKKHGHEFYEAIVPFPADGDKTHAYYYKCHSTGDWSFGFVKNKRKSIKYETFGRDDIRDRWQELRFSILDPVVFEEVAISAHLYDLLFHCPDQRGIGQTVLIIEELCVTRRLPLANALRVIQVLGDGIMNKTSRSTSLYFVVTVGAMLKHHDAIIHNNAVSQVTCSAVIKDLEYFQEADIPTSIRQNVYNACLALCKNIYKANFHLLLCWNNCCLIFEEPFLLKRIQENTDVLRGTETDEVLKNAACQFCEKMCNKQIKRHLDQSQTILEILFRTLPFDIIISVYEQQKISGKELGGEQLRLQDSMYSAVKLRIETDLNSTKKNKNLKKLFEIWESVRDSRILDQSLRNKFADSLLSIIEITQSQSATGEKFPSLSVLKFLEELNFYENENSKQSLLQIAMESNNSDVNGMFLLLADNVQMTSQYHALEQATFEIFFLKYAMNSLQLCSKQEKEIPNILGRLCNLANLRLARNNENFEKGLIHAMHVALDRYQIANLLTFVDTLDAVCETNLLLKEIVVRYLQQNIEKRKDEPEELLKSIPTSKDNMVLNTRLAATAVCSILDTISNSSCKESVLEQFLDIVSQCTFWVKILHCSGKFSDVVKSYKKYQEVYDCILTMIDLFKMKAVPYNFVQKLEKNVRNNQAAKALLSFFSSKTEIEQFWSDATLKFTEVRSTLSCIREVLSQVKIREVIITSELSLLIERVKITEDNLLSGKITVTECDNIWSQIEDLPNLCKNLHEIVHSAVFWNVSAELVKREFERRQKDTSKEEEEDPVYSLSYLFEEIVAEDTSMVEHTCLCYLETLQNFGIAAYVDAWRLLINDETCRMEAILKMFGAEPNVKREFSIASTVMHCSINKGISKTIERIFTMDEVQRTVLAMESVLNVFCVDWEDEKEFSEPLKSFKELLKGQATDFSFKEVKEALEKVFSLDDILSEDTFNIMMALERASILITFLKAIVDEDIKNLIDAVEDISEQQVRESTVSSMIEVKQYLYPLLTFPKGKTCTCFLQTLERQTNASLSSSKTLPQKIEDCVQNLHNLKSLYNGVANRGEQTKEIIKNIIQKGIFHFFIDESSSTVLFKVSYKKHNTKEVRNQSTLIDLRSRALLLMNSEKTVMDESRFNRNEFTKFIEYVDLCTDIAEILFALYSSGHLEYMKVKELLKPEELFQTQRAIHNGLETWMVELSDERQVHYLMNFVQGSHIHALYRYLELQADNEAAIQTLLNFIHPELDAGYLKQIYVTEKQSYSTTSNKMFLQCIGYSLHTAYLGLPTFHRSVSTESKSLTSIVQSNKLMVVHLEENSPHIARTVLSLYMNTTGHLPEPFQILFCSRETSWIELDLLLQRCLGSKEFYRENTLFCISNVEMLPSDIQYKLVEGLCQLNKSTSYLLAVLCRGSRNHPFISELSECVTSVKPVSDKTVIEIFHSHCPNVVSVTSDQSGLGKTSKIKVNAHRNGHSVSTLHISGPLRKTNLIDRLLKLKVDKHMALHIDIGGIVDDVSELDIFLFELVVLRYVSAGRVSADLKTTYVFIEIANTINEILLNSLQTAVLFKRMNVKWNGVRDFVVSKELYSSVQVVCHYLNALDKGSLDKVDLIFEDNITHPLSSRRCKSLLQNYIHDIKNCSYPTLFTFLGVLSDQLKKMSGSSFFRVKHLIDMIGNKVQPTVKSKMIQAIIEVSKDFATRSVDFCRGSQTSTINMEVDQQHDLAHKLTCSMDSMIRWEDSNHMIFVFHNQNINTISALYRHLSKVPVEIRTLFEGQMKKNMQDFSKMTQEQLRTMLQKVARVNPLPLPSKELMDLSKTYALTADNLLKMVLIMLRVKANIPVIVMGETGCGKTSLIRYLAGICQVKLEVMNIHAGVPEKEIIKRVLDNNTVAENAVDEERWLFLDEINTSENIGLISDIICHHRCLGHELSPNLVVMAACNPYKLRTVQAIATAGLEGKVKTDELSRLVYRVLPLPEMMVDYVWDFGALNEIDEEIYIQRIVDGLFNKNRLHLLFTSLVSASQAFVRKNEGSTYSVSLRDVQRCKLLANWFMSILPKKKMLKRSQLSCQDINIKSMILSLAHCYQSRFADKAVRLKYRRVMGDAFKLAGYDFEEGQESFIQSVIKEEQADILNRMTLPSGTAKNTALEENVFIILVCIFNKIPIFVVGKPGCSKSLAMQLIKSNLRGKDSEDDFFKTLPQLYCVSFQGSESSTSDGIIKVFEKAKKYQDSNSTDEVFSVVILDEIGLAEVSRFNPLKVLHSLLEPEGQSQPDVAVVGISNWALDASKMNRAIHLSRPDMDEEELLDTAYSISESFLEKKTQSSFMSSVTQHNLQLSIADIQEELRGMASAYFQYIKELRFRSFHGLRDYYSLIKFAARKYAVHGITFSKEDKADIIVDGIARNFGGLPEETQTLYDVFKRYIPAIREKHCSVMHLVTENIVDPIARHLMLITTGESVLGTLEETFKKVGCERREIIFGSQFEEDLTDDYNYRILSRIILCMEEGIVLILKDLESIYGSLYDMLNQNYRIIGKKKHCRIALGPYSNPICRVADTFRCIVLTEENNIRKTDPPFLNRFEKQYLRFFDIVEDQHLLVMNRLERWIESLTMLEEKQLSRNEIFSIYNKDLVASLVLKTTTMIKNDLSAGEVEKEIENVCKNKLLGLMRPDAVIRQKLSNDTIMRNCAEDLIQKYFALPIHNGLENFIQNSLECSDDDTKGFLSIILTNSNIHANVPKYIGNRKIQVEKLGNFKSEKQLTARIHYFWKSNDCTILIIQCCARNEGKHVLLTKLIVEKYRNKYCSIDSEITKHVYLVVHLDKNTSNAESVSQLNFLSDWTLVMVDNLDTPDIPLPLFYKMTLTHSVENKRHLTQFISGELPWAYSRMRFGAFGKDVSTILDTIKRIERSDSIVEFIKNKVISSVQTNTSRSKNSNWHVQVASDITALKSVSTFTDALDVFIQQTIRAPLAKLVFQLEEKGIIDSFLMCTDANRNGNSVLEKQQVWMQLVEDRRIFSFDQVPDETGPECFTCSTANLFLKMPFSMYIFESIETTKDDFMETVQLYRVQCMIDSDEDLPPEVHQEVLLRQENFLLQKLPDLNNFTYSSWQDDYFDDFCTITSQDLFKTRMDKRQAKCMRLILERLGIKHTPDPFAFTLSLHTSFWIYWKSIWSEMQLIDNCIQILPQTETEIVNVLSSFKSDSTIYNKPLDSEAQEADMRVADLEFSALNENALENQNRTQNKKDLIIKDVQDILEDILLEVTQDSVTSTSHHEPKSDLSSNYLELDKCDKTTTETYCMGYTVDETNCIRDFLVQTICRHMFPTTTCLIQHNGMQKWLDKVNSIVSLAAKVSRQPDAIYALRICSEFCSLLFLPLNMDQTLLENVGDLLESGFSLDSASVYNALCTVTQTALSAQCESKEILVISHRLLSSYFVRCLAANPETMSLKALLDLFKESKIPPEYTAFYKVPLTMFLQTIEETLSSDVLERESELDMGDNSSAEKQLIEKLDNVISFALQKNECDNHLLVLLTDILQEIFTNRIADGKEHFTENETLSVIGSEEVDLFYKCHLLIKQSTKELKFIAASAFCRCFISRAVSLLNSRTSDEICSSILGILDIVLSDLPGSCNHGLFLFFQKEMLRCRTTAQFEKFCCKFQEQYRFLRLFNLKSRNMIISHDKMHLCLYVAQDVHVASCFLSSDCEVRLFSQKMEELCHRSNDVFGMLPLFQFMIREFYLQKAEGVLDATRRSQADIILDKIVFVSKCEEVRTFARCVLGSEDFKTNMFMLSELSNQIEVNICSFLVSFYSIILADVNRYAVAKETKGGLPFLFTCLIEPENIAGLYIPGFRCRELMDYSDEDVALGLCRCGKRVFLLDERTEIHCRICNEVLTIVPVIKTSDVTYNLLPGRGSELLTTTEIGNLNPITYHILQFLVKGCLLGSLALQYISEDRLTKTFGIQASEEQLSKSVIGHWIQLQQLMNIEASLLSTFLHILVLKVTKHVLVDSTIFLETNSTLLWEHEFDEVVCTLVELRFENLKHIYQKHIKYHENKIQQNDEQLLEIDDNMNMTTDEGQTLSLPLFRLTAQPTMLNFCSELFAYKQKYPLLELVMQHEEELKLPKHIMSLVQWQAAVVANGSYVLKRHECLKMTVQDFIYFKQDSCKKDVMKKRFDAFRKSWEYLKTKPLYIKCSEKMGRIHSESKMSECLILGEESLPFQLIKILVKIQNSFLESVLRISDNCNLLNIQSRESCPVPFVQVTDLKTENLLEFTLDWDSIFRQESTCDLRYGHGRQIHYDFLSMEEFVAKHVVAGKVFIAIDNLPKIIFLDELHINYASLVKQLRINVHQQSLSPDVISGIKYRQEEDPRTANDLITHLGIVMTMMKKIKCNPDQSLVDFVEKWKSGFGRRFPKSLLPNPESSVKLCHVVALSELLEELCADSVKEGLSDVYREKLDGPLKDHLLRLLRNEGLAIVLVNAFKRFTYRCLSSQTADPDQSIRIYLSDESFWPVDTYARYALTIGNDRVLIEDILPDGLMVRHVFDCFSVMETELEKQRQGNIAMSGFATSFQNTPMTRMGMKKKKTTQYRQF